MPAHDAGFSLSQKVLGIVLSGLWVALAAAYFALAVTVSAISADTRETKGAVGRIEARLKIIDEADAVNATDQRNRAAARIAELEAREKQRNSPK